MVRSPIRTLTVSSSALVVAAALAVVGAGTAHADVTFVVDQPVTSFVPQPGELGWAIEQANASIGADVIEIQVGSIELGQNLPTITDDVAITGNGATIDGGFSWEAFEFFDAGGSVSDLVIGNVSQPPVSVSLDTDGSFLLQNVDITTSGGFSGAYLYAVPGSSIRVDGGSFTNANIGLELGGDGGEIDVVDVVIDSPSGAGITVNSLGDLAITVRDSRIRDSAGFGVEATMYHASTVELSGTAISGAEFTGVRAWAFADTRFSLTGGSSIRDGDGIALDGFGSGEIAIVDSIVDGDGVAEAITANVADMLIERSTISGGGTGLAASVSSSLEVSNSTFGGHAGTGVALDLAQGATARIAHSTVSGNGGSGLQVAGTGTTVVTHSIIAGNATSDALDRDLVLEIAGAQVDWSLVGTSSVAGVDDTVPGTGGAWGVIDPGLEPLADNGGPTLTRLPATGSPAIDAGDPAVVDAPGTDQRGGGFVRVLGSAVDIGAVELQAASGEVAGPSTPTESGEELPPTGADAVVPLLVALALLALGGTLGARRRLR